MMKSGSYNEGYETNYYQFLNIKLISILKKVIFLSQNDFLKGTTIIIDFKKQQIFLSATNFQTKRCLTFLLKKEKYFFNGIFMMKFWALYLIFPQLIIKTFFLAKEVFQTYIAGNELFIQINTTNDVLMLNISISTQM